MWSEKRKTVIRSNSAEVWIRVHILIHTIENQILLRMAKNGRNRCNWSPLKWRQR